MVHSDDYLYKSWSQGVVNSDDYLYKSRSREGGGWSIATIICTNLGVGGGGGGWVVHSDDYFYNLGVGRRVGGP